MTEIKVDKLDKRFRLGQMAPEDIKACLIEQPFTHSPEINRHRLRDIGPAILKKLEDAIYRS